MYNISKKIIVQFWEYLVTDGRTDRETDRQTDDSDVIRRCPTNVKRSKLFLIKVTWRLKKWSIVKKVKSGAKLNYCNLYLFETLFLTKLLGDTRILNKKSEFVNKCRHYIKHLIKNLTRNDSMDWWSFLYDYEFYNKFSVLF